MTDEGCAGIVLLLAAVLIVGVIFAVDMGDTEYARGACESRGGVYVTDGIRHPDGRKVHCVRFVERAA